MFLSHSFTVDVSLLDSLYHAVFTAHAFTTDVSLLHYYTCFYYRGVFTTHAFTTDVPLLRMRPYRAYAVLYGR